MLDRLISIAVRAIVFIDKLWLLPSFQVFLNVFFLVSFFFTFNSYITPLEVVQIRFQVIFGFCMNLFMCFILRRNN
jgi:hypothetical protein